MDITNQSRASAGRDIAGGNITTNKTDITNVYLPGADPSGTLQSALEKWIGQLEKAKETDDTIAYDVANLAFYRRKRKPRDGIVGLEAKLQASGREEYTEDAVDQKLAFEMLLQEWSLFASAQEIFAYLLAKIDRNFKLHKQVVPVDSAPHVLDSIIDKQVLEPIVDECGRVEQFEVNLNIALGMLYWLADQCVIRWHK